MFIAQKEFQELKEQINEMQFYLRYFMYGKISERMKETGEFKKLSSENLRRVEKIEKIFREELKKMDFMVLNGVVKVEL